jgi:hypothetical protein
MAVMGWETESKGLRVSFLSGKKEVLAVSSSCNAEAILEVSRGNVGRHRELKSKSMGLRGLREKFLP